MNTIVNFIDLHTAHSNQLQSNNGINTMIMLNTFSLSLISPLFSLSHPLFHCHSHEIPLLLCAVESDYYKIGHFAHSIDFEFHCETPIRKQKRFTIEIRLKFNLSESRTRYTHGKLCESYSNCTILPPSLLLLLYHRNLS